MNVIFISIYFLFNRYIDMIRDSLHFYFYHIVTRMNNAGVVVVTGSLRLDTIVSIFCSSVHQKETASTKKGTQASHIGAFMFMLSIFVSCSCII